MNCSEITSQLALYADGVLDEGDSAAVKAHLNECPLCREKVSDLRDLRSAMGAMRRPEISASAGIQLRRSLKEELLIQNTAWLPVSAEIRSWLRLQVMPYAIGAVASVSIGIGVLATMFSGFSDPERAAQPNRQQSIMLASNRYPFANSPGDTISATAFAKSRLDVSSESPSVNPQGALVALTRSLVRGGMRDDEVVVVADVFGNGLAQVAEVVEPSRDVRAVAELQKALDSDDPAHTPFVAANLDNRSDSVRVILKFQSVDVPTRLRPRRP